MSQVIQIGVHKVFYDDKVKVVAYHNDYSISGVSGTQYNFVFPYKPGAALFNSLALCRLELGEIYSIISILLISLKGMGVTFALRKCVLLPVIALSLINKVLK